MKRRRSPQERKIRDYCQQRGNDYGENDKTARRAVRKRKRWVNRAYRKSVNDLLTVGPAEQVDLEIAGVVRHGWRKLPDELTMFQRERGWSGSTRERCQPNQGKLKQAAKKRLRRKSFGLPRPR